MKKVFQYLGILVALLAAVWITGCASCGTCQGATWHAVASPQTDAAPPPPPVPHARPIPPPAPPADDFATPPTDGPAEPEEPPTAPPTRGKVRTRVVKETEADGPGVVIENTGSGSVVFQSPGATPPASAPAPAATTPQPQPLPAYPLIPGPLTDQQYVGLAKRIGGGIYYAVTGKCPSKPTSTVQVPVAASYVQQVQYATVPVQTVAVAAPQAVPVQAVPVAPAPTPGYYLVPQAAPQAVLATPQSAPKKSLFHCFKGK